MSDNEELDWFDKADDDDDDLKELHAKLQENIISAPVNAENENFKNIILEQSAQALVANSTSVTTPLLDSISKLQSPLDKFLAAATHDNFFVNQIQPNDSVKRVLLYASVASEIVNLQLPGFHQEILSSIANDAHLMVHLRIIVSKMFETNKKRKCLSSVKEVQSFVDILQSLMLRMARANLLPKSGFELLKHIQNCLQNCADKTIATLSQVQDLKEQIKIVLESTKYEVLLADQLMCQMPLHPSIKELLLSDDSVGTEVMVDSVLTVPPNYTQSVSKYLLMHKVLLRDSFLNTMRCCVQAIRLQQPLPHQQEYFENVCIVLNDNFLTVHRHELLFVDMHGLNRAGKGKLKRTNPISTFLNELKTGSMLVFTTSRDFDNLILACVTYTGRDLLHNGYIGIEIVYQCNIGIIYNKPLLMFETPEFYEASNNIYNFLQNCNASDFPLKEFIIDKQKSVTKPQYIKSDAVYQLANNKSFRLFQKDCNPNVPLNKSQKQAFCHALRSNLSLIQGPPGTGKTFVSTQLVSTLIRNAPTPLVVITYTNASLDKFLLQLTAHTRSIARFGSQTRLPEIAKYNVREFVEDCPCNPRLKRLYFIVNTEYKDKFALLQRLISEFDGTDEAYHEIIKQQLAIRDCKKKLECIKTMFQYYVAKEQQVLAMTTTCAAKLNFLFQLLKSPIVIFEEAAEISPSHIIASLTPYTQHVIMIGDHMQLRPFSSNFNCSNEQFSELNISLFERFIQQGVEYNQLLTQYRMRPIISDLLCPTIYAKLLNDSSVEQYKAIRNMSHNLFFLKCSDHEGHERQSIYNTEQAKRIVKLFKLLTTVARYDVDDIVILSPYAAQVKEISSLLKNVKMPKVCTVDSFQGLEANIVLLSLVRSNAANTIGFLEQKNRICVALSRAKQALYITGNLDMLTACSPTWQQISEKLIKYNAIGVSWPFVREKQQ